MTCEYVKQFEDKQRCLYNEPCRHQITLDGMAYCGDGLETYQEVEMVSQRLEEIIKNENSGSS